MKMKIVSVVLGLILALGCMSACSKKENLTVGEGVDMIKVSENYFVLENEKISVLVDRGTGYVATVKNKTTGTVNKNKDEGRWPFYIEYSPDGDMIYESSIAKTTNNRVSGADIKRVGGTEYLTLTYDSLVCDGKSATGTNIKAEVRFSLSAGDEYFKFNVGLDLSKTQGKVMALHMAAGGDLRSGDGASEYLTAPLWGRGSKWQNPIYNSAFLTGRTLGYPGVGSQTLEAGWIDLSGDTQGVGVAYINKQQLASEFRIESSGSGMGVEVVLFHPQQLLGEYVPLEKGDKFVSDDMVIGVHSGSWHAFADIYREEFNAAFVKEDGTPDYLTADTISKRADSTRYFLREIGAVGGVQSYTVAQQWQRVQNTVNALGIDYDKTFYWQVGINGETYGKDTPHLKPFNENLADAGETFIQSYNKYFGAGANAYKGKGGSMMQYSHPFSMATNREDLTALYPSINPYQHKEDWDGGEHWSVCIDNDTVTNLWKNTLLPEYKEALADAIQFDQGSLVQTVCDMEGHNHGLKAVDRLSSHVKAINKLAKLAKQELGSDSYLLSEATNDLTCRYIDIRQNHWLNFQPLWEGEFEYGAIMYTHPQYVYCNMNFIKDTLGNTQEFYLESTVMGGIVLLSDGANSDNKIESVRLSNALRERGAEIGYPHGYRDTLGLKSSSPFLFARVYVKGDKVTVVYSSNSPVKSAQIELDLGKLGFAGKGKHTFEVKDLGAFKGGFQTYTVA